MRKVSIRVHECKALMVLEVNHDYAKLQGRQEAEKNARRAQSSLSVPRLRLRLNREGETTGPRLSSEEIEARELRGLMTGLAEASKSSLRQMALRKPKLLSKYIAISRVA